MEGIENQIYQLMTLKSKGTLFFPQNFLEIGSSEAIRKSLQRLVDKEKITRVTHGIYVIPKENKYIGAILPSAAEVAKGIAKRDKIRILPTGVYAVHMLGLSTQIPMNLVYLTDGSPREIIVGKQTIKLKKSVPKNLLVKDEINSLVIQALKEIGQKNVTEVEELKVIDWLKKEQPKNLNDDLKLAPVWIQKIMKKAL